MADLPSTVRDLKGLSRCLVKMATLLASCTVLCEKGILYIAVRKWTPYLALCEKQTMLIFNDGIYLVMYKRKNGQFAL